MGFRNGSQVWGGAGLGMVGQWRSRGLRELTRFQHIEYGHFHTGKVLVRWISSCLRDESLGVYTLTTIKGRVQLLKGENGGGQGLRDGGAVAVARPSKIG